MRVAGRQVPWWSIAIVVLAVAGAVFAFASAGDRSDDPGQVDLPGTTQEPAGSTADASSTVDANPAKNPSTEQTGSPGGSNGSESDAGTSDDGAGSGDSKSEAKTGYLFVKYWNDTVSNKPGDVEIVVGEAVWSPRATQESDQGKVGPIPIGTAQQLVVFPDGRDGQSVTIPILLRADMSGSDRDSVHVEVRDSRLRILGSPVIGFEVTADRG